MSFNEKGHSLFNLKESPSYNYWFDIVTAYQDEDIVANYNWDLTSEGQDFLEEYSIPIQLPAVIASNRLGFQSYYFAGDYVDVAEIPSLYKIKGLASLYKWFTDDEVGSTKAFFWKTYVPMLKGIFHIEKQRNDLAIPER